MKLDTIFRLTTYRYIPKQKNPYPSIRVFASDRCYFQRYEDAVKAIGRKTPDPFVYCLVVSELPLALEVGLDESLSEYIFDGNGSMLSSRTFAIISDRGHEGPTTSEWVDYFNSVRAFDGWKPEQLRFRPGDIVEIHGREGNMYYPYGQAEIGIITSLPSKNNQGLEDCYGVMTLSLPCTEDHAPVCSVFEPHFRVPRRISWKLKAMQSRMNRAPLLRRMVDILKKRFC